MAESNRMIEGYPVASITVPTERSTHYGLRPPPTGSVSVSPTAAAAAMPRPADSAFVQVATYLLLLANTTFLEWMALGFSVCWRHSKFLSL